MQCAYIIRMNAWRHSEIINYCMGRHYLVCSYAIELEYKDRGEKITINFR